MASPFSLQGRFGQAQCSLVGLSDAHPLRVDLSTPSSGLDIMIKPGFWNKAPRRPSKGDDGHLTEGGSIAPRVGQLEDVAIQVRERLSRTEAKVEHCATQADLARVEGSMKADLARVEGSMKADLARVEGSLKAEIVRVEQTMTGEIVRVEQTMKGEIVRVEHTLRAEIMRAADQQTWRIIRFFAVFNAVLVTLGLTAAKLLFT
jgi:hypothetical protein